MMPLTKSDRDRARLNQKVAIVTGGSRGIGAAIATAFAAEGASVAVIHHGDDDNASSTLRCLSELQKDCIAVECDVGNEQQVEAAVDAVRRRIGTIHILVNCAGIGGARTIEETTLEFWAQILSVNLTGAFLMTRYCFPLMKKNRWGRIINISSQMAFSGGANASAYCASKAGLIGFTRAIALEAVQFGVLVNAIAPGATLTDMLLSCGEEHMRSILQRIPLGRFGSPEEIAPTAVMLASDEGAFYVGQTLSPNGGDVLR